MTKNVFALIAEGDVFATWTIADSDSSATEMLIAGLQSNPIVVEIPEDSGIDQGWTFDGKEFHPPAD